MSIILNLDISNPSCREDFVPRPKNTNSEDLLENNCAKTDIIILRNTRRIMLNRTIRQKVN
jgi:hypothetical protein